jgi:hypothetical protein
MNQIPAIPTCPSFVQICASSLSGENEAGYSKWPSIQAPQTCDTRLLRGVSYLEMGEGVTVQPGSPPTGAIALE